MLALALTLPEAVRSPFVPFLLDLAAVVLCVGLVLAILRYRKTSRPATILVIVALSVGLVAVVGVWGYASYQSYVDQNTWSFGYFLTVQGNGSAPESLVVPIVGDESLLEGLHLRSGIANWSMIDTARGRGLFVRFTGSASLEASVSQFPAPAVLPDTSPTMTVSSNCTAQPSNCTGPPGVWVYYSGLAGAHLDLSMNSLYFSSGLSIGWASYQTWPIAIPVA